VRRFRPHLSERYFHFFGHGLFVHPAQDPEAPVDVELTWADMPAGWSLANSFGAGEARQRISTKLDDILSAIYVGGDFRLHRAVVDDRPVQVAVRGEWKFEDGALVDLVQKLVHEERTFWNDHEIPYYLVTLIPDGGRGSRGGTGVFNAFSAVSTTESTLDGGIDLLFAHELFHTWNGRKIRLAGHEKLGYWFTEGFTNYYGRLLALRAGALSLERYVEDLDREIERYMLSRVRNEPNERLREAFWSDEGWHMLPYQRGDLLAHNWNAAIRAATGGRASLDDVMRDLLAAARDHGARATVEDIDGLVRKHLPAGILGEVRRYVDDGQTIAPSEGALGPCARLERIDVTEFELGFDRASIEAHVVRGVVRGSAAERAGLRDGQKLRGVRAWLGDTSRDVQLDIEDARGRRSIVYAPHGKKQAVPQWRLDAAAVARDRAACLSWFR
jgi:predicted metalloprotease with PDZ domain